MPPEDEDQPGDAARVKVVSWLGSELEKAHSSDRVRYLLSQFAFGNHVSHKKLFGGEVEERSFSPPRLWRINPNIYDRTKQRILRHHWEELRRVRQPFALEKRPGINDYAVNLYADSATLETLLRNARTIVEHQLSREVSETFRAVLEAEEPSREQIDAAVRHQFKALVYRLPSEVELKRYREYMLRAISEAKDLREGMAVCLKAIALLPEAVYRMELGLGEEDEHGRRRMSGSELAFAISFALTTIRRPRSSGLPLARASSGQGKVFDRRSSASLTMRRSPNRRPCDFSRSSLDITVPRMCSKMRSAIGTTIGATSRINSCTRPIYWCCTFWIETRMCCVSC